MLTIATLIWGTALVAQSFGSDYVGPFTFNGMRFILGSLVLVPIMLINKPKKKVVSRKSTIKLIKAGSICGLLLFAVSSFQQAGLPHTTIGKAGFITSLYIIIVPLLGYFRNIKPDIKTWGFILVAVTGMYLLCIDEKLILGFGDTLILMCAIISSFHILAIDRYAPQVDCLKFSSIQFAVCGVLSFISAFIFEAPEPHAMQSAILPVLYTGILSSGVAYTLMAFGQRDVSPVAATLIYSLEAVFSVLCGWLFFNEMLSPREILGCVLMFSATLGSQIFALGKTKRKAAEALSVID